MKKGNKRITLIALIITIIILILAMVSIKIIMNGGIIIKAQYAMDKYIIEDEKEKISLAYGEYRMAQLNHLNHTMQDALDNHKADAVATDVENGWNITFNKTKHQYYLTNDGKISMIEQEVALEEGSLAKAYVDGNLKIAHQVDYKPASGYSYTSLKENTGIAFEQTLSTDDYQTCNGMSSTRWQVLGVNERTGVVNLIASEPIKVKVNSENKEYQLWKKEGYEHGREELNNLCKVFGYGKGASGARSVNEDDINSILGYEKTHFKLNNMDLGDNVKGNLKYQYSLTYKTNITTWEEDNLFLINGENTKLYNSGKTFKDISGNTATDKNPITIESKVYLYSRSDFEDKIEDTILNMVFKDQYYLANQVICGLPKWTSWGLYRINNSGIDSAVVYYSDGLDNPAEYGVRPVVSLKANIKGTKDEDGVWQLLDK